VAEGEMARPREFNEVTALEAAVECFWQHGYKATSVRDLARKGCFLVNSALEVAPHQSELGAVIAKQLLISRHSSKGAFSPPKLTEQRLAELTPQTRHACCSGR